MASLPRRAGTASVATLAGLVLAIGLAHAIAPETVRAAGLDIWSFPAVAAEYEAQAARGDRLAAVHEVLFQQIEASDRVAELLIAGELTLPDAAAELEDINRDRPDFGENPPVLLPRRPDPPRPARPVRPPKGPDPSRRRSEPTGGGVRPAGGRIPGGRLELTNPGFPYYRLSPCRPIRVNSTPSPRHQILPSIQ